MIATVTAAVSSVPGGTGTEPIRARAAWLDGSLSTKVGTWGRRSAAGNGRVLEWSGHELVRVDLFDLAGLDLHDDRGRVDVLAGLIELDGAGEREQRIVDREPGDGVPQRGGVGRTGGLEARGDHQHRLVRQHASGLQRGPVLLLVPLADVGERAVGRVVVVVGAENALTRGPSVAREVLVVEAAVRDPVHRLDVRLER